MNGPEDNDESEGKDGDYEPSPEGEDVPDHHEEGHINDPGSQCREIEDPTCKEKVKVMSEPVKVKHVTLMEPVETRGVHHVIAAMDKAISRMNYLGICVTRHTYTF